MCIPGTGGPMDRFKILKGINPPSKNTHTFISADGKVIGKFDNPFPEEALTTVNGQRGWLNKNGSFYPEDEVKKAIKNRQEILSRITIRDL